MTLGIFLAMGNSFENMAKSGQDELFKEFYLSYFAKNFEKIYVFSYANEKVRDLPNNVQVVPNKYNLHRYLYGVMLPFLNMSIINKSDVIRAYHLFGTIPAIIAKIFFNKTYIFNFAYDYQKIAQIEGQKIQEIALKLLKPVAVLFSSGVFVASKSLSGQVPRNKAIYLPNGVDTNFFKPRKTKANKRPLVLSVGRLEKQKNFESLIEAMKGIKANLLIVGNGSLKSKLLKLAIKNRVNLKIIKKVENTQMPQIYNQADIFVLPSQIEGSPKVLLEAMSCGLPVVGANVEGMKEIIRNGENGLLCKPDSDSIQKAIRSLLRSNKFAGKFGQNARKYVTENFDLRKFLIKETKLLKDSAFSFRQK